MTHDRTRGEYEVESYLLGELRGAERENFEEHLFECAECAEEVRQGARLLGAARQHFAEEKSASASEPAAGSPVDVVAAPSGVASSAGNALPAPAEHTPGKLITMSPRRAWWPLAAAACLLIAAGYQNLVEVPGLRHRLEIAETPSVLHEVVLAGATPRGGPAPVPVTIRKHGALLLSVDVPGSAAYQGYLCSLRSPSGKLLWQLPVAAGDVKDAVAIRVPAEQTEPGDNVLLVQGIPSAGGARAASPVDLATYRFNVTLEP